MYIIGNIKINNISSLSTVNVIILSQKYGINKSKIFITNFNGSISNKLIILILKFLVTSSKLFNNQKYY